MLLLICDGDCVPPMLLFTATLGDSNDVFDIDIDDDDDGDAGGGDDLATTSGVRASA